MMMGAMVDREIKVQEFKSDLESDLATLEAEIATRESELGKLIQERDGLRQLIEGTNKYLSGLRDNGHSETVGTAVCVPPRAGDVTDHESSQESGPAVNGVPGNLTRRQIIMRMVPAFGGNRFSSGDIRERFVQDHLDGVEPPNFPQAINNLLKRMADKGEIQDLGRYESEPGAPRYYREIKSQEENLLGP